MGYKKQAAKNRIIVIQKEKKRFATHILDPFIKVPDPKKYQVDLIN